MPTYDCAVSATRGAREYQEDTAALWPGEGPWTPPPDGNGRLVAVLADGMGGHAGGALASRLVCEHFIQSIADHTGEVTDGLVTALAAANDAVAAQVQRNRLLDGMGSTVVGVEFGADHLHWVSVGDSPLYLWRAGEIAMLNEDHSLGPDLDRLAASGVITVEQARRDPRRHMLRSAVTGDDIELVDVSQNPLKLEPGDYVILATDGVQTLDLGEIERLVSAYCRDGAAAVAAALIRAVDGLRELHQDNATVIVVRPLFE
jgi:protein phosphatase